MESASETRGTYQNHRDNQHERIIAAAEMMFIQTGIENASISAIADAAGISRKTMYAYFADKRDLAWAVFEKLLEDFKTEMAGLDTVAGGNGFQRLESFIIEVGNHLRAHPDHFRFLGEFNGLYARENDPEAMRQFVEQHWGAYDFVAQLVREGIADGSLRPDLDVNLTSAALLNMTNAVSTRFALLSAQITQEYGLPVMEIYREIHRAFMAGIQAPISSQERTRE
jgi:AcrR family transcriptional regulator